MFIMVLNCSYNITVMRIKMNFLFACLHFRKYFRGLTVWTAVILLGLCIQTGGAAAEQEEKKMSDPCEDSLENERVPTGTIASVGTYGPTVVIDADIGDEMPGGEASVILASIQVVSSKRCRTVVRNVSECNAYKLGIRIREYDSRRGRSEIITSETITISPEGERELFFSCDKRRNYRVEITSSEAVKRN
jgi:hypothetical protein